MGRSSWIWPHSTAHCCTSGDSAELPLGREVSPPLDEAGKGDASRALMVARRVAMKERTSSVSKECMLQPGKGWIFWHLHALVALNQGAKTLIRQEPHLSVSVEVWRRRAVGTLPPGVPRPAVVM